MLDWLDILGGIPLWLSIPVISVLVVWAAVDLILIPRRVRAIGYHERQDDLLIRRGILFQKLEAVPYGRLQYVDIEAGPIMRKFGLCTVQLKTASSSTDAPSRARSARRAPACAKSSPPADRPAWPDCEAVMSEENPIPDAGPGGSASAAADQGEAWFDETWTRVHPLSPFVRGWLTVVAVPVAVFGYNWQMWRDLWELWRSGELMDNVERNPMPYVFGSGGACC